MAGRAYMAAYVLGLHMGKRVGVAIQICMVSKMGEVVGMMRG